MKTEQQGWDELRRHAAAQLSPGFADQVLRLARAGVEAAPSFLSYCALSAATAALCLAAVALFTPAASAGNTDQAVADWQQIAEQARELAVASR